MGRPTILPEDINIQIKLRMQRVPFIDGCYDTPGGAYWGSPENLWCAWNDEVTVWCRAESREEAKNKILTSIPGARFFR